MLKIYSSYLIEGLNQERIINSLRKKDIALYRIKKYSNKKMSITIENKDNKKFFAYFKDMCYNVTKIKEGGILYPLFFLKRNIGIAVGILIFIVFCFFGSNFIFSIDYSGSGALFSENADIILSENGVRPFSFFKNNTSDLSMKILSECNKFSFASVKKTGNRLKIELILAKTGNTSSNQNLTELIAPSDGIIEDIKAYRGTSLCNKGDIVKKGDVLVNGTMTVRDKIYETYIIASVNMICEYKYEYISKSPNDIDIALIFAKETLGEYYITDISSDIIENENGYLYNISLFYRIKI